MDLTVSIYFIKVPEDYSFHQRLLIHINDTMPILLLSCGWLHINYVYSRINYKHNTASVIKFKCLCHEKCADVWYLQMRESERNGFLQMSRVRVCDLYCHNSGVELECIRRAIWFVETVVDKALDL